MSTALLICVFLNFLFATLEIARGNYGLAAFNGFSGTFCIWAYWRRRNDS